MMRKKLQLTILSILLIAMVPAVSVFAGTVNVVSKVPKVAAGAEFTEGDAPCLRIEEVRSGEFSGGKQEFLLELDNAIWSADAAARMTACVQIPEDTEILFEQSSETVMGITITGGGLGDTVYSVDIPLLSVVQEAGLARCTVDARDSAVTGGTYVYAEVIEPAGAVRVSMGDTVEASSGSKRFTLGDLVIEESAAHVLSNSGSHGEEAVTILLRLKEGLEFDSANVSGSPYGGLSGSTLTGRRVGRSQLELKLDTAPRTAALRGGIIISDLQVTGRRLNETTDIHMDVVIRSGTLRSEETLYAGICTVEDFRLRTLSLGDSIVMSPAFDPDVRRYKATVPKSADSISLELTAMNPGTPITLNNDQTYAGETVTIPLKAGKNSLRITVGNPKEKKGSRTYVIEIARLKK